MKKNIIFFQILFVLFFGCEEPKKSENRTTSMKVQTDTMPKKKVNEPDRLKNVPSEAIWGGHLDGGFWFELIQKYDSTKYRFRIYNDYKGDLVLDADFIKSDIAKKLDVSDKKDIKKIVFMYKYLKMNDIELKPVYPAYGGSHWETAKKTGF